MEKQLAERLLSIRRVAESHIFKNNSSVISHKKLNWMKRTDDYHYEWNIAVQEVILNGNKLELNSDEIFELGRYLIHCNTVEIEVGLSILCYNFQRLLQFDFSSEDIEYVTNLLGDVRQFFDAYSKQHRATYAKVDKRVFEAAIECIRVYLDVFETLGYEEWEVWEERRTFQRIFDRYEEFCEKYY